MRPKRSRGERWRDSVSLMLDTSWSTHDGGSCSSKQMEPQSYLVCAAKLCWYGFLWHRAALCLCTLHGESRFVSRSRVAFEAVGASPPHQVPEKQRAKPALRVFLSATLKQMLPSQARSPPVAFVHKRRIMLPLLCCGAGQSLTILSLAQG